MAKRRKGARKPVMKNIKGVGPRCVLVKANGQWKFRPKSACRRGKKR